MVKRLTSCRFLLRAGTWKKCQVSQNVQNIQQRVTGIPRQQAKIFCGALHRMLPNLMKQQPHPKEVKIVKEKLTCMASRNVNLES